MPDSTERIKTNVEEQKRCSVKLKGANLRDKSIREFDCTQIRFDTAFCDEIPMLRSRDTVIYENQDSSLQLIQANSALLSYRVYRGVPASWHLTAHTRYECTATTKIQWAVLSLAQSYRTHRSAFPETQVHFTSP